MRGQFKPAVITQQNLTNFRSSAGLFRLSGGKEDRGAGNNILSCSKVPQPSTKKSCCKAFWYLLCITAVDVDDAQPIGVAKTAQLLHNPSMTGTSGTTAAVWSSMRY